MNLPDAIALVERELEAWDAAVPRYTHETFNYDAWSKARAKAQAEGEYRLIAEGAAIRGASSDYAIRLAGIRSTSTGGFHGALTNWLRAAKARLAKGGGQ